MIIYTGNCNTFILQMHIGYYISHIGHLKYLNSESLLDSELVKWTLLSVGIVLFVLMVIVIVIRIKRRDKQEVYKTKPLPIEEKYLRITECELVGYTGMASSSDYLTQQTVEKQQGVYIECQEESNLSSKLPKIHSGKTSLDSSAIDCTRPSQSVVCCTTPTEYLPPQVSPPTPDAGYEQPVASPTSVYLEPIGSVQKLSDGYKTPVHSARRMSGNYLHHTDSAQSNNTGSRHCNTSTNSQNNVCFKPSSFTDNLPDGYVHPDKPLSGKYLHSISPTKSYNNSNLHPDRSISTNNQSNALFMPDTTNLTDYYIHPDSADSQSGKPRYPDNSANDQDGQHLNPASVFTHGDVYLHPENTWTSDRHGDQI